MKDVNSELRAFGMRVRQARERMALSQDAFAQKLGVDTGMVGKWERGLMAPRMLTLVRLCDLANCSMDWVCGRVGPVKPELPRV